MHFTFFTTLFVFLLELRTALAVPTGFSESQVAATFEQQPLKKPQDGSTVVGMAFKGGSSEDEEYFELPLNKRVSIRECPGLPIHPSQAVITGIFTTQTGLSGVDRAYISESAASNIICMAYPKSPPEVRDKMLWGRSTGHAESTPSGKALVEQSKSKAPAAPVWWKVGDGWVDFENGKGRWFLKGQEVEALICV